MPLKRCRRRVRRQKAELHEDHLNRERTGGINGNWQTFASRSGGFHGGFRGFHGGFGGFSWRRVSMRAPHERPVANSRTTTLHRKTSTPAWPTRGKSSVLSACLLSRADSPCMRILANENIPRAAVLALRDAGHDALWVRESMMGAPDAAVLARAQAERRI